MNDDEGHTAVDRQMVEKQLQRIESASGSTNSHDV